MTATTSEASARHPLHIEGRGVVDNRGDDSGIHDLSEDQLQRLEALFTEYDCSFRKVLLFHPQWQTTMHEDANANRTRRQHVGRLRILYPHELFAGCDANIYEEKPKPLSWLIQGIVEIASE